MISKDQAERFAQEWIDSWNAHDLDRILSHYSDDLEMSSPYAVEIAGEPSGALKGKAAVAGYWRKALDCLPNLRFEHVATLTGVRSITIYYKGVSGMAAEVFFFDDALKVVRTYAHYA